MSHCTICLNSPTNPDNLAYLRGQYICNDCALIAVDQILARVDKQSRREKILLEKSEEDGWVCTKIFKREKLKEEKTTPGNVR